MISGSLEAEVLLVALTGECDRQCHHVLQEHLKKNWGLGLRV